MDDEIKTQIALRYDAIQILDILGMEEIDLVDALEDKILENLYLFNVDEELDYGEDI